MSQTPELNEGYERRDTRTPLVLASGAALVIVIGLSFIVSGVLDRRWTVQVEHAEEEPHPMAGSRRAPTAALLQAQPIEHLQAYQQHQRELVESYGWIDREAGVVRIPVQRAMEILLERETDEGNER